MSKNEYFAPIAIPPSEHILEIIQSNNLFVEDIEKRIPEIKAILDNKQKITMDIAYALGKEFGINANFFINIQRSYWKTLERLEKEDVKSK